MIKSGKKFNMGSIKQIYTKDEKVDSQMSLELTLKSYEFNEDNVMPFQFRKQMLADLNKFIPPITYVGD